MSAISTDCVGPKHGPSVAISKAQIEFNSTHGDFNFTIKNTSDATITATCGFYVTLATPHVLLEVESVGGVHGNATAVVMTPALPAAVRPLETVYVPVRTVCGTTQWSYATISNAGVVTIYKTVAGDAFNANTAMQIANVSGKWSVVAF